MEGYAAAAAVVLAGILLVTAAMIARRLVAPRAVTEKGLRTYESGVDPVGVGWAQSQIRYISFAFLYVVFAVDAVYLFPWALVLRDPDLGVASLRRGGRLRRRHPRGPGARRPPRPAALDDLTADGPAARHNEHRGAPRTAAPRRPTHCCAPTAPRHRAPSSTCCAPPPTTTPTRRPSTTAARCSPTTSCSSSAARRRRPPCATRASAAATGSACASRPAPPTSTSPSSASCSPAPPTCRSTHDDPDERARLVFDEAGVAAVVGHRPGHPLDRGCRRRRRPRRTPTSPTTPGSSSPRARPARPRASRSRHRSAAAFVDAEARMFLQDEPIGPGDRVMAGLSVAFDASLRGDVARLARTAPAWCRRRGRWSAAGMDLGPWLVANDITVVSTVPTLVALWPAEALDRRPAAHPRRRGLPARDRRPARRRRTARSGTPTAPPRPPSSPAAPGSTGEPPVRIGLPLDGWDLAVVDAAGPAGRRRASPAS